MGIGDKDGDAHRINDLALVSSVMVIVLVLALALVLLAMVMIMVNSEDSVVHLSHTSCTDLAHEGDTQV